MQECIVFKASSLEVLDNYKGESGFFVKTFLIDTSITLNDWRVTWDAIVQDAKNFVGYPDITYYRPDGVRDHPEGPETGNFLADRESLLTLQEQYKSGLIVDVILKSNTQSADQVMRIDDPVVQQLITDDIIKFVSPSLYPMGPDYVTIVNEGMPNQYREASRFLPNHIANVDDPAFGKDKARVKATCNGTPGACQHQLAMVAGKKENNSINEDKSCCSCQMEQKDFDTKIKELTDNNSKLEASFKKANEDLSKTKDELEQMKASKTKTESDKENFETKIKALEASNTHLEKLAKRPLVEQILQANVEISAISEKDLPSKREELMKASLDTLSSQLEIIKPFAAAIKTKVESETVPFGMGTMEASTSDKSAEELLAEVYQN